MTRISPEGQVILDRVRRAYDREVVVLKTAEEEARRLIETRVAEARATTNAEVVEALRNKVPVSHIHNLGLGTKSSKRVYDIKNSMDWTEPEEPLSDVKVLFYDLLADPQTVIFSTSVGEIECWGTDTPEEPILSVDGEQDELIEKNKPLFLAALKEYFSRGRS